MSRVTRKWDSMLYGTFHRKFEHSCLEQHEGLGEDMRRADPDMFYRSWVVVRPASSKRFVIVLPQVITDIFQNN
jgi:hypothetical protein